MANSLFRQEAIDFKSQAQLGGVVSIRPLSYALITLIALSVAIMIVTFLWWGEYTRKAQVKGFLAPSEGLIKVRTPESGLLIERFVREGQKVKRGDRLFEISTERSSRRTAKPHAEAIAQIKRRRDSFNEELAKQHKIHRIDHKRLNTRLEGLKAELKQIDAEIDTQDQRLISSSRMVKRYQELSTNNFVSEIQVQEKQDQLLEQKAKLQSLERNRLNLDRDIADLKLELESGELEALNQWAETTRNISSLEQQLTEYESKRNTLITAPCDGMVTTILARQGQSADPGSPLLSILPEGSELVAQLLVPSRAIGFIKPEQTVAVRYQAFPYQRFGSHQGRVEEVSKTLITAHDTKLPVSLEEPVYRITVVLNSQTIKAYREDIPLKSGMLLDADIWLEHQRVIDWVFDPLYSLKGRV